MTRDWWPLTGVIRRTTRARARLLVTGHWSPVTEARRAVVAFALWLFLNGSAIAAGFVFGAFGDTPYSADDEERFPGLIAGMNREPLAFVVHVGDFKAAVAPCSDELYLQRKEWFELSHHPLVFLPGDNEWTDCRRGFGAGYDPQERMQKLRQLFFSGSAALGQRPLALARQPAATRGAHDYPEHARWEYDGVVFLTLNAPGPDNNSRAHPEEYSRRLPAMLDWITRGFRLARTRNAKAVVVVMHANPWNAVLRPRRGFSEVLATLAAETRAFGGAVLLLHGDTHHYRVDQPLRESGTGALIANLTRVEVFGYPAMNWVRIRVVEENGRVRFEAQPGS